MKHRFDEFKEPFRDDEIEWRVQRCGVKGNKIWAQLVPYVTARAIFERLDKVAGPGKWQTEIIPINEGFLCRLGIYTDEEWIWRTDGAPTTDIEALKGGISGAIKRVAVQFGMGAYLYSMDAVWAENIQDGYAPKGNNVQIVSKKDDILAWCPAPTQQVAPATNKPTDEPPTSIESPGVDPRLREKQSLIERCIAGERTLWRDPETGDFNESHCNNARKLILRSPKGNEITSFELATIESIKEYLGSDIDRNPYGHNPKSLFARYKEIQ